MTYHEIRTATKDFTRPIGLRVGASRRYTRYLQPGLWDKTGKLMLRMKRDDRHVADARYDDERAIESLTQGAIACEY
jgi:hypothetical protein